jgi:predicted component of type VI protein secretion system
MLESGAPEKHFETLRQELVFLACAYLDACSARKSHRQDAMSHLKALTTETVNAAAKGQAARLKTAAHQ